MYCTVCWTEENLFEIISCARISAPRKEFTDYKFRDFITAKFQGKDYPAEIVDIDVEKKRLVKDHDEKVAAWLQRVKDSNVETTKDQSSPSVFIDLSKKDDENSSPSVSSADPSCKKKQIPDSSPPVSSGKKTTKRKLPLPAEAHAVIKQVTALDATKRKAVADTELHCTLGILNTAQRKDTRTDERLSRVEKSIANLSSKIDQLFSCRNCLRKIYKRIDQSTGLNYTDQSPCFKNPERDYTEIYPCLKSPEKDYSSDETTQAQAKPSVETMPSPEPVPSTSGEFNLEGKDRAFLGNAKYGVLLAAQDIQRANKTAKNADKLALNLIEFLLNEEELKTSTVYGNKQHGKVAIEENKRNALKTHIFAAYPEEGGKWDKIVISLNDKIRKLRKGLYN